MQNTCEIVSNAIKWAKAHINSDEYTTMCLGFIEDAVERSNGIEIFGGDSAQESADIYDANKNTGMPPVGAFVFYSCGGLYNGQHVDWGHCGLSLGDGQVIHAWNVVRIDNYLDIQSLTPPPGWTAPLFIGWVPIERVLEGSVQKDYGKPQS